MQFFSSKKIYAVSILPASLLIFFCSFSASFAEQQKTPISSEDLKIFEEVFELINETDTKTAKSQTTLTQENNTKDTSFKDTNSKGTSSKGTISKGMSSKNENSTNASPTNIENAKNTTIQDAEIQNLKRKKEIYLKELANEKLAKEIIAKERIEKRNKAKEILLKYLIKKEKPHVLAYILYGNFYLEEQKTKEAFDIYTKGLVYYPKDVDLRTNIALVAFFEKRYQEAAVLFLNIANELKTPRYELYYQAAVAYYHLNDINKSLEILEKIENKTLLKESWVILLATAYAAEEKFTEMLTLLEKYNPIYPENSALWKLSARAYLEKKDYNSAITSFQIAKSLKALSAQELEFLQTLYQFIGTNLLATTTMKEQIIALEQEIVLEQDVLSKLKINAHGEEKIEQNKRKTERNKERIKKDKENEIKQEIKTVKEKILNKKEELFAQYLLAGRKNEALHVLDTLLKEHKKMYYYLQKGQIYLSKQKYNKATDAFLLAISFADKEKIQLVKDYEKNMQALKKLSEKEQEKNMQKVRYKEYEKKQEKEHKKKVQKLDNTLGQCYFFLAISYFEKADWLNAQRTFEKSEKYEKYRSHSEKMLQFLATIGYF